MKLIPAIRHCLHVVEMQTPTRLNKVVIEDYHHVTRMKFPTPSRYPAYEWAPGWLPHRSTAARTAAPKQTPPTSGVCPPRATRKKGSPAARVHATRQQETTSQSTQPRDPDLRQPPSHSDMGTQRRKTSRHTQSSRSNTGQILRRNASQFYS